MLKFYHYVRNKPLCLAVKEINFIRKKNKLSNVISIYNDEAYDLGYAAAIPIENSVFVNYDHKMDVGMWYWILSHEVSHVDLGHGVEDKINAYNARKSEYAADRRAFKFYKSSLYDFEQHLVKFLIPFYGHDFLYNEFMEFDDHHPCLFNRCGALGLKIEDYI